MHDPVEHNDLENDLAQAAELLRPARRVAVLTGAGISAESGLATFRGAGGLWEGHRVEDVATPSAFRRDPSLVWRFYNLRRANLRTAQPNAGHRALAELEQRFADDAFTLVTQNVDGLHRAAGNRRVCEIHGSLRRVRCTGCGAVEDRGTEPLDELPHCACGALLRPDVVWFNEPLPPEVWTEAAGAAAACECFLVVGTSAIVYPAAELVPLARFNKAKVIEVNLTRTPASQYADVTLCGPAGRVLPELLQRLQPSGSGERGA